MPLYEFACSGCATVYEELLPIGSGFDCPSCGKPAQKLISVPSIRTDDNLTARERTAAFLDYGRDPSSRAELRRLREASGKPLRVGIDERTADDRVEKKPFALSEQQKHDAVEMVRSNRAAGRDDRWRMGYTENKEVISAAESASKELIKNGN